MTKEKIIEIVNACVQYNANQGTWSIDNRFTDELLALFKQEKKEQAREIFGKITELFPTDKNFTAISRTTIKALAKEYGVEL